MARLPLPTFPLQALAQRLDDQFGEPPEAPTNANDVGGSYSRHTTVTITLVTTEDRIES